MMPLLVERSAFCAICPASEDVTQLLARFGLRLTYSQPEEKIQTYRGLPPLPAQYHYEDDWGTQVQFLAGPDTPCLADDEDENDSGDTASPARKSYPPHASRFWLIAGAHELRTRRLQDVLAAHWALHWHDPHTSTTSEIAA